MLFVRGRGGTVLSELGERMRPHLEQSYAALQLAREEAQAFNNLERAVLHLGVMCTVGPTRLIGLIERLRTRVPSLEIVLHELPGKQLVEEMTLGRLDVAIIGLPRLPDGLRAHGLFSERYVVAFPPGHRFEGMSAVPLGELTGEDYLQRLNCEFDEFFDELGVPDPIGSLNVRFGSQREEWIQALVLAGMGCAVMPEHLPLLPALKTRVLVEPEVTREIKLVTVGGRRFSPAVEAFVRLVQAYDWKAGV